MGKVLACVLSGVCIVAGLAFVSPANATTAVCYDPWSMGGSTPTAGPVCGDIDISGTNMTVTKDPLQSGNSVSLSGGGGGTGVGALVSVSGSFGVGHISASSFTPAQNGNDSYTSNARGFLGLLDKFTVTGGSVSARVTQMLEGAFSGSGEGDSIFRLQDLTTNTFTILGSELDVFSFKPSATKTTDVFLSDGHTYEISWSMKALADARVDFFTNRPNVTADLSNTGKLFIDVLSGGSLVFESGHDYSTNAVVATTPLPPSLGMMLLALGGLGTLACRKKPAAGGKGQAAA